MPRPTTARRDPSPHDEPATPCRPVALHAIPTARALLPTRAGLRSRARTFGATLGAALGLTLELAWQPTGFFTGSLLLLGSLAVSYLADVLVTTPLE